MHVHARGKRASSGSNNRERRKQGPNKSNKLEKWRGRASHDQHESETKPLQREADPPTESDLLNGQGVVEVVLQTSKVYQNFQAAAQR